MYNNGQPVSNFKLWIENPYDDHVLLLTTDENGNANYTLDHVGENNLKIRYESYGVDLWPQTNNMDVNITVNPLPDVKIIKNFKSTRYSKIKSSIKLEITNCKDLIGKAVTFKIITHNKIKTYHTTLDANGITVFKIPSKLDAGTHNIQIIIGEKIMKTASIKIDKARTTVKTPKKISKHKTKHLKVTIKNKETKKPLSKVKVKIKIYTGKKSKTYTVKTNKNGIAKISAKKLKTGKQKIRISSANKNYDISAKKTIKIEK